jgi:hypothetical protein
MDQYSWKGFCVFDGGCVGADALVNIIVQLLAKVQHLPGILQGLKRNQIEPSTSNAGREPVASPLRVL